jgi:anti-sigma B factor antagonist
MSVGEVGPGRVERPEVLVDVRGAATVVSLSGEHDVFTAPEVRGRFASTLEAGTPLIIDLSGAAFVDSSILGAVIGAVQRARDENVAIAVVLPGEGSTTHRIFEITGLLPLMPRAASVDHAIDLVRSAPA